jgi:SAM-dependent methyltransferase
MDERPVVNTEQLAAALQDVLTLADVRDKRAALEALERRLQPTGDMCSSADTVDGAVEIGREYVLERLIQASTARTAERADYYLRRLIRGLQQVRTNGINDINLNRWQEYEDIYTDSLWIESRRDSSGVHNADYWGNFIPQIPHQLMRRFTRRGDWVLDPFAGTGTTLIEGQRLGRSVIGVELQAEVAQRARELLAAEPNPFGTTAEVVVGDSAEMNYQRLLEKHSQEFVQLIILHPPYYDIIRFSADPRDLSNAGSLDAFLAGLQEVVQRAAEVLQAERHLALVIGDKYAGGEWIPLGFHAMNRVLEAGFRLKSLIVKNFEETAGKRSQRQLWRYRALAGGFYIFKHEYIFLFQKVSEPPLRRL